MEDAIRNAPLFLALDEEASVALRASMVEIDFTRGQIVFSAGDPGDRLYVIMDGKIKPPALLEWLVKFAMISGERFLIILKI